MVSVTMGITGLIWILQAFKNLKYNYSLISVGLFHSKRFLSGFPVLNLQKKCVVTFTTIVYFARGGLGFFNWWIFWKNPTNIAKVWEFSAKLIYYFLIENSLI